MIEKLAVALVGFAAFLWLMGFFWFGVGTGFEPYASWDRTDNPFFDSRYARRR